MYKNAFLSEFSFSDASQVDRTIKCHLLSNETIVVPAGTAVSSRVGEVLAENIRALGGGAVVLAHGSDCADLAAYIDKYPDADWSSSLVDVFQHFDTRGLTAVYRTETTTSQFNALMRDSARGQNSSLTCMFGRRDFCEAILRETSEFALPRYMELIDAYVSNPKNNAALKAHAKYAYNYFGSFSTSAGNTFSLENTMGFDHICAGYDRTSAKSGIEILIAAALDLTVGIEDLRFLESLDGQFLDKLSYSDILEIRETWLHQEVLRRYDELVQACASSYSGMQEGDVDSAVRYVERAFEIREGILREVRLSLQSEVNAYKIHRLLRFLADTSVKYVSYFSNLDLARSVADTLRSAVTEIAVATNKQTQLNHVVAARTLKIRRAAHEAGLILDSDSPALEYLRTVARRLDDQC